MAATEERPARGGRRLLALNQELGQRLVELATGHGLSVADYCDREFGADVARRWRAMLAEKLQAVQPNDPPFANSLEGE